MSALAQSVSVNFSVWTSMYLERFERAATRLLPPSEDEPARLHQAMRYAVLDGGKRVRPLLVYAAGEALGGAAAAEALSALDAAALAVEYVHAYSLIHDDLPCMDNDVLRRGKPTVHVAYDEATAMLAGDALQAEAFKVLADAPLTPLQKAASMRELAMAASTRGMCGGQALDLAAVGQALTLAELERMHRMKTGALLVAAVRLGALAVSAQAQVPDALERYAQAMGLAFQIVDDVLDVEGSAVSLGKTAGKDALHDKPTYVSLMGVDRARARAQALHQEALSALKEFDGGKGFDGATERLRELADFIVLRNY